jgi:hypothetical protein
VKAGKPEDKDGYEKIGADGLELYVKEELSGWALIVEKTGWWIFSGLTVLKK